METETRIFHSNAAPSANSVSGRTYRRCRPRHPPPFLGNDIPCRAQRDNRIRYHALHGRGRILRPCIGNGGRADKGHRHACRTERKFRRAGYGRSVPWYVRPKEKATDRTRPAYKQKKNRTNGTIHSVRKKRTAAHNTRPPHYGHDNSHAGDTDNTLRLRHNQRNKRSPDRGSRLLARRRLARDNTPYIGQRIFRHKIPVQRRE